MVGASHRSGAHSTGADRGRPPGWWVSLNASNRPLPPPDLAAPTVRGDIVALASSAVIDLHTHSLVSDGTDTPARIADLAHEAGCSAVALTDHDSLDGLSDAGRRASELGLTLVPGCEVSCVPLGTGGLHVLVYLVDDRGTPLGEELDRLRADRRTRNARLAERLVDLGVPISYEDVVAEGAAKPASAGRTSRRPWSGLVPSSRWTRHSTAISPTGASPT